MAERPEGAVGGQMQEEAGTEVVRGTGQISVGTGEASGAEEGHIGAFHLARAKRSRCPD